MIWKLQPSPVFWVPVPYDPNTSIGHLTDWQYNPDLKPETLELRDPDTNQIYKAEILDLLGPYLIDRLPNWMARQIGGRKLNGRMLAAALRKKKPEFKEAQKVWFYQVNPLTNDNRSDTTTND